MTTSDQDIRRQLRLGEDSRWEFKRIEFAGDRPVSPSRDDLADEMVAFANASGGFLLCGVADDGSLHGMSRSQMVALDRVLVDVCTDSVDPPLRVDVHHRELDGAGIILVEVPRGDALHERGGRSFIRVGASKCRLTSDERMRLAQRRGQVRYQWFDEQAVPNTGFGTLDAELWKPLLSAEGATEPRAALAKLGLLTAADADVHRATVAGILLCTREPDQWLANATIAATRYRGPDRASGQFDAQEIRGPLDRQIAAAIAFVVRNMQVAAEKTPARVDMPQYSTAALFEAIVNAVAHRDYGVRGSRVRLSMFEDRVEIQSPGPLPNNLTVESIAARQATRNQTLASALGRMPVAGTPGSDHRRFFMERRGDGVPLILRETATLGAPPPEYEVVDDADVRLTIRAAPLRSSAGPARIVVHSAREPVAGVDVLVLLPNRAWQRATTSADGQADVDLHATHLPAAVFVAATGFHAEARHGWVPEEGPLEVDLTPLDTGGAVILAEDGGSLPGLRGTLRPVRDALDRTCLYTTNIAVDEGKRQPVYFLLGEDIRLTDADGGERSVRIVDIVDRSALVEYRPR